MYNWLFLALAVVFEVISTSALKQSDGFTKLYPTLTLIVGYGISFYLLSLTLRTIPVGVAYAVWSGLGVVLITCIGWVVFKQGLDLAAVIGMSFIVLGVIIMNLFSNTITY